VARQRSEEGYQNIPAALKVPKNTVASIILQWKKYGTTKTLPRAGYPAKLSNRRRRALVREVTKNPMATLTELHSSSVEMGEPSRMTSISIALHQSGLYSRVARRKPLLSKKHMSARLKSAKTMRNQIMWSDDIKIELFGLNAKRHVWRKSWLQHYVVGMFLVAETGRLVRIEVNMNGAKYREILDESLPQSAQGLSLGQRFTFQPDNDPRHTAKSMQG
jgi:hypothetical protein